MQITMEMPSPTEKLEVNIWNFGVYKRDERQLKSDLPWKKQRWVLQETEKNLRAL